ncbi:DUF6685 family protein [Thiopseudomonas alkaliphila]|uniref:DUF6685 family protein n=1 Tax=Thiopseudomonas alkaliphila TaxID=1697053 RepID=UPI0025782337|nr:DUF6685 family protein [Thiopseudomonas alkaliphila]MDM1707971.1 hypothetical protein [Thiopseudomonas alkaliphila]
MTSSRSPTFIRKLTSSLFRPDHSAVVKELHHLPCLNSPIFSAAPLFNQVFFNRNLPLATFYALPSNALSGPVQQDKAKAHAYLKGLIQVEVLPLERFNICQINGLKTAPYVEQPVTDFAQLLAASELPNAGIISFSDFKNTLSQALPNLEQAPSINLTQASWLKGRTFWETNSSEKAHALASALQYAQLRQIDWDLPALLTRYTVIESALLALKHNYHALIIPEALWVNSEFMHVLVNNKLPYVRFNFLNKLKGIELLLLPKNTKLTKALGYQLIKQGALELTKLLK